MTSIIEPEQFSCFLGILWLAFYGSAIGLDYDVLMCSAGLVSLRRNENDDRVTTFTT